MNSRFRVEPWATHNRLGVSCGQETLDRYLQTQATHRASAAGWRRVFAAVEVATGAVAGYYTLAAAGISMTELPPEIAKKLPRYPSILPFRIGGWR